MAAPATSGVGNNDNRDFPTVRLLDSQGAQVFENQTRVPFEISRDLEAGIYTIEIIARRNGTGQFFITANFLAANNNEREPNNTAAQAHPIVFGQQVRGFISYQDVVDMYRIVVPQAGRITINLTRPTEGGLITGTAINSLPRVRLLDSNLVDVPGGFPNSIGSSQSTNLPHTSSFDLEAGTYYFEFRGAPRENRTGVYFLTVNFNAAGNNEREPNNSLAQAQPLTIGQAVTGFLSRQDAVDIYRFVVTQATTLTTSITGPTGFAVRPNVRWLNSDGIQIESNNNISLPFTRAIDFTPGTYYLEVIRRGDDNTGVYNLVVSQPQRGWLPATPAAQLPFLDSRNHWASGATGGGNYIGWAVANGITTGTTATAFSPSDDVTRAQFVTFLWRMSGSPSVTATHNFTDVATGQWFTTAVAWAHYTGVSTGTSATTFSPHDNITRQQIATMLFNFVPNAEPAPANTLSRFTDSGQIAPWAQDGVAWAAYNEIMGRGLDTLTPRDNAARSHIVAMLYRVVREFNLQPG